MVSTWSNYWSEWRRGVGMFAKHPPKWDGQLPAAQEKSHEIIAVNLDETLAASPKNIATPLKGAPPRPASSSTANSPALGPEHEHRVRLMAEFVLDVNKRCSRPPVVEDWNSFAKLVGSSTICLL